MLLECKNICVEYKGFTLQDVSFSLPGGYLMGLTGKNGSGKSTLLETFLKGGRGYRGQIWLDGEELGKKGKKGLNDIGYIASEQKFFEEFSVGKNAQLLRGFYDNWDQELFEKTLQKMNLHISKIVGRMSLGERAKFQMAFAMAHRSKLYLIDEATAGMDPIFRKGFYHMLKNALDDEQAAAILVSHIPAELDKNMDYIGVMEEGKLISFTENFDEGGR